MGILNNIVDLMSKEEIRQLKIFLTRTNSTAERKDIQLFDALRKKKEEEDDIQKKLYGKEDKNAFYRLKNRLLDDVGKSMTLQYYHASDSNSILYFLALSRLFREKGSFKVSTYYLNKAEKKAREVQSYELLEIIYSDYIRLSQETLTINPENYIEKRAENRRQLNRLREIDDILAMLIYRIRMSQNYSSQNPQVINLLQKTIKDFSMDEKLMKSPQVRFKIYHSLSRILVQQRDYAGLEAYLQVTLKEFTEEGLFDKNNHETKLQMLTYLCNALYKNQRWEKVLEYAEKLKEAMLEYDKMLFDKYLFYYYNSTSLAYSQLKLEEKSISMLTEALKNPQITKAVPHSRVMFYGNLALLHFDLKDYKQANRSIVRLKLEDIFANLDPAFQLKIYIAELIIRYETEDHDFVEYQAEQVKKQFKDLLTQPSYERQKEMIDLLAAMIYQPLRKDEELKERASKIIAAMPNEEAADSDLLNYNEWLRSKLS